MDAICVCGTPYLAEFEEPGVLHLRACCLGCEIEALAAAVAAVKTLAALVADARDGGQRPWLCPDCDDLITESGHVCPKRSIFEAGR